MKIQKTFEVDCAHVLDLPYPSKCRNLHGHTYRIIIGLEGEPDANGMLLDYTKFPKDLVMEMDHKLLAAKRHDVSEPGQGFYHIEVGLVRMTLPSPSVYLMDGKNTTAEEIARHLYQKLFAIIGPHLESVSVSETEATQATYP